jgi:cell division protein FtsI/penicillin-binding protein 2
MPSQTAHGELARRSSEETEPSDRDERLGIERERADVPRARLLTAIFLTIILVLTARLVLWQVSTRTTEPAVSLAEAETQDRSRGRIIDSNGILLATDMLAYELYATPHNLRESRRHAELVQGIAQVLDRPPEDLESVLSSDVPTVQLARDATRTQCDAVKSLNAPMLVWCEHRHTRVYPERSLGAHIVGIADYDQEGVSGVEWSYDSWLRTAGDWPSSRLSGQPEPMPDAWRLYLPSPGGRDLVLHLNLPLQHKVEERLAEALVSYQAETGTIIVMDPRIGSILALANWPSFDPNDYANVAPEILNNEAAGETYEPGSVFKLITYAAALDSGQITPDQAFYDDGELTIGGRTIRNAQDQIYGDVTAREALAKSINVIAARICLNMGAETFYRYVRQFGFGKLTEVDLSYEDQGIVKRWDSGNWSTYDQAANSFGQGISVTTLQMINAVAAIANHGVLLQPQVARGLVKDGTLYRLPSRVMSQAIRPETAHTLTQMMVYNVDSSSYANLVPGYRIAGKTGTAEIPTEEGYTSEETITSFAGFLPAADPQIVILVKIVKPKSSQWAEKVAVPVFQQVAQDAVGILRIPPDERLP